MKFIYLTLLSLLFASCSNKNNEDTAHIEKTNSIINYVPLTIDNNTVPNSFISIEAGFPKSAVQTIIIKNKLRTSLNLNNNLQSLETVSNLVVENNCPENLNRLASCSIKLTYTPTKEEISSDNNSITILGNEILVSFYNTYVEEDLSLKEYNGTVSVSNSLNLGNLKEGDLKNEFIVVKNLTREDVSLPDFNSFIVNDLSTILANTNIVVSSDCPENLSRLSACRIYVNYSISGISESESINQEVIWENSFFNLALNASTVYEDLTGCSGNSGLSLNSSLIENLATQNKVIIPVKNTTRNTQNLCIEDLPHYIQVTQSCDSINRLQTCYLTLEKDVNPTASLNIKINGEEVVLNLTGNDPIPPRFSSFRLEQQLQACSYDGLVNDNLNLEDIFGINKENALQLISEEPTHTIKTIGNGNLLKLENGFFALYGSFGGTLGTGFWDRASSFGLLNGTKEIVNVYKSNNSSNSDVYFLLNDGSVRVFSLISYNFYNVDTQQNEIAYKEDYIQERLNNAGIGENNTLFVKKIIPTHTSAAFLMNDNSVRVIHSSFNANGTNDSSFTSSGGNQNEVNALNIGSNLTVPVLDVIPMGNGFPSRSSGYIAKLKDGSLRVWGGGYNQSTLNNLGVGVGNTKKVKEIFTFSQLNPGNAVNFLLLEDGSMTAFSINNNHHYNDQDDVNSINSGLNERGIGPSVFNGIKVEKFYLNSVIGIALLEDKSLRVIRLNPVNISQEILNNYGIGVRSEEYPVNEVKDLIILANNFDFSILLESGHNIYVGSSLNTNNINTKLDNNNIKRYSLDESNNIESYGSIGIKKYLQLNQRELDYSYDFSTQVGFSFLLEDDSILLYSDLVTQSTLNSNGYGLNRNSQNPIPIEVYTTLQGNNSVTVFELSDKTFTSTNSTYNNGFLAEVNSKILEGKSLKNVYVNYNESKNMNFLFDSGEVIVGGGSNSYNPQTYQTIGDGNITYSNAENYLEQFQGDFKISELSCKISVCDSGFIPSEDGKSCEADSLISFSFINEESNLSVTQSLIENNKLLVSSYNVVNGELDYVSLGTNASMNLNNCNSIPGAIIFDSGFCIGDNQNSEFRKSCVDRGFIYSEDGVCMNNEAEVSLSVKNNLIASCVFPNLDLSVEGIRTLSTKLPIKGCDVDDLILSGSFTESSY